MRRVVDLIPPDKRPRRKVVAAGLSGPVVTGLLTLVMSPGLAAVLGPVLAAVIAYLVPEGSVTDPVEPAGQPLP